MEIINKIKSFFPFAGKKTEVPIVSPDSSFLTYHQRGNATINTAYYNGEKTPLELGNPINYEIDYYAMRERAWEAYLTSDIAELIIIKHCLWIVGSGLKLQSQPTFRILEKEGINLTEEQQKTFIKDT
jgi:hypothetical protein